MTEGVPRLLWDIGSLLWDIGAARRQGAAGLVMRQRRRLAEQVAYARAHSRYYRDLYQGLPDRIETPEVLPVTTKVQLMERFDDWVTDPAVTLEEVQAFVDDPATSHQLFHGRYRVITSSGTTGARGISLRDHRDQAVTTAMTLWVFLSSLSAREYARLMTRGVRCAGIGAPGGRSASALAAPQGHKLDRVYRMFSCNTPLPELVEQLNGFRPTVVFGYAGVIALLAGEQQAGRLRINPVVLIPGAEVLPLHVYDTIAAVFGARVRNSYATSELLQPNPGCRYRWLHFNSDWAVIEPVDAEYQPVPPGQPSHTVLISNLVSRVTPFLRYQLGDSVLMRPDPCPCGSPLPAFRVQGRVADALDVCTASGALVQLSMSSLVQAVDRTPQVEQYQIVQISPTALRVRFRPTPGAHADDVWINLHTSIAGVLSAQHLENVDVQRASEPAQQSVSGKYRAIIPLSAVDTTVENHLIREPEQSL